jgi:hypothetical protein
MHVLIDFVELLSNKLLFFFPVKKGVERRGQGVEEEKRKGGVKEGE